MYDLNFQRVLLGIRFFICMYRFGESKWISLYFCRMKLSKCRRGANRYPYEYKPFIRTFTFCDGSRDCLANCSKFCINL